MTTARVVAGFEEAEEPEPAPDMMVWYEEDLEIEEDRRGEGGGM